MPFKGYLSLGETAPVNREASITPANSKYIYNVGETAVFHATANFPVTSYWIGMNNSSGERLLTEEMTNASISIPCTVPGDYSIYVSAIQGDSGVDSPAIVFRVFQPADIGTDQVVYIKNHDNPLYLSANPKKSDYAENVFGAEKSEKYLQKWKLNRQTDGSYCITLANDGRALDVDQGKKENGTNIEVYASTPSAENQKFYIYNMHGAYYIKAYCSDNMVDVTLSEEGHNITTWGYGVDWEPQKFDLISAIEIPFQGSGTKEDPYQIATANDLRMLSKYVNDDTTTELFRQQYYIQTADIDLENENFTPIGTREESGGTGFNGHYDGNHKIIRGLYVNRKWNWNGLFGWIYGGSVENLTVYGNIDCPNSMYCGGFVGDLGSGGTQYIRNCAFIGSVSGKTNVAGIAGCSWLNCNIENCYFNGIITLSDISGISGGIIGLVNNGHEDIAGKTMIKNCYSVCQSSCTGGVVGEVSKKNDASAISISNNYYLKTTSESGITGDYTDGCKGISESMMQNADELLGKPFIHNDNSALNDGYPVFEWQNIKYISGDVNDDGEVDITDVITLQKFILAVKNAKLINASAADLNGDGIVDVFDLGLLKRKLISIK